MIISEDNNYLLEWDESGQFVCFAHRGFSRGEELRSNGYKMLNLFKEKQASKLLLNTLEMKVLEADDQQWMNQEFIPRVIGAGLRYQAILVPTSALGALSLKSVVKNTAESPVEIAYFSNRDEAEEWLRTR